MSNRLENQRRFHKRHPEKRKEYQEKFHSKFPWRKHLYGAKERCNGTTYSGRKYYVPKGIECHISEPEIMYLWFRDSAYKMNKPSLDRIDNNGHYSLLNCRFIEHALNSGRSGLKHGRYVGVVAQRRKKQESSKLGGLGDGRI